MMTVILQDIPDDLLERLRKSADRHGRTLDREALACIERGLDEVQPDPAARLERIRESRSALAGIFVTDADLRTARDEAAGLTYDDFDGTSVQILNPWD